MKQFAWTAMIETGVPDIDREHKHLFELYNSVIVNESALKREQLLSELMDYALTHFAHEEDLMMSSAYPLKSCTDHFREHRDFVTRLKNLAGEPDYMILDFIQEWLLRHIMVSDFLVALHLKRMRESKPEPDTSGGRRPAE